MEVIIKNSELVIITEPKDIHFDLPKDVGNNSKHLKHEIYFIIKHNEFLAEHTIKIKISQLLSKYKHGNDIHDVLDLSESLELRSPNKHVALQNSSIYYTWKNLKQQFEYNQVKIIAST